MTPKPHLQQAQGKPKRGLKKEQNKIIGSKLIISHEIIKSPLGPVQQTLKK
jgi:hypothetical protein